MKASAQLTIALIALLTVTRAQEIPPELVHLNVPYVQAVTTIRANADARAKNDNETDSNQFLLRIK